MKRLTFVIAIVIILSMLFSCFAENEKEVRKKDFNGTWKPDVTTLHCENLQGNIEDTKDYLSKLSFTFDIEKCTLKMEGEEESVTTSFSNGVLQLDLNDEMIWSFELKEENILMTMLSPDTDSTITCTLLRDEEYDSTEEMALQEEEKEEPKEEPKERRDDGIIVFRGLDWYLPQEDVLDQLFSEGGETGYTYNPHRIEKMTDSESYWFSETGADGGGYYARLSGLQVAGYEPSETWVYFIYPINNGVIERDDSKAGLYFAYYEFDSSDFTDHVSIYKDLGKKLLSVYGKGKKQNSKYSNAYIWKDSEGNMIRLWINDDRNKVCLGYLAADAEERLDSMLQAIKNESAAAEEEERRKNESNTSGL